MIHCLYPTEIQWIYKTIYSTWLKHPQRFSRCLSSVLRTRFKSLLLSLYWLAVVQPQFSLRTAGNSTHRPYRRHYVRSIIYHCLYIEHSLGSRLMRNGRWWLSYQEVPPMSAEWFYIERWRKNREDSEANKKNKKTSWQLIPNEISYIYQPTPLETTCTNDSLHS